MFFCVDGDCDCGGFVFCVGYLVGDGVFLDEVVEVLFVMVYF